MDVTEKFHAAAAASLVSTKFAVETQAGDVMFVERVVYGKVDSLMSQSLRVQLGHAF